MKWDLIRSILAPDLHRVARAKTAVGGAGNVLLIVYRSPTLWFVAAWRSS